MKKPDSRLLVAKLLSLVGAAFVFGCAPPPPANPNIASRSAALRASSSAITADSEFRCPTDYNILLKDHISPQGGYDYSGAESFKVCTSRSNANQFKITGITASRTVCMYPMRLGATGAPAMAAQPQCFGVSGGPITATFTPSSGVVVNYMLIVDVNFTNALTSCLSDTTPCPAHSEGFVQ